MDLHGGTPFPQALDLPMSLVTAYLESRGVKNRAKVAEAQGKNVVAVIGRIDGVVKAIGGLAKAIGRVR